MREKSFLGLANLVALLLLTAAPARGQQEALSRAFDLERQGNFTAAVEAYRSVLAQHPADPGALLGVERGLTALNRLSDIIPDVQAALRTRPAESAVYGVALRTWARLDKPDSARRVLDLWTSVQPGDEAPYREWGNLALSRRDRAEARRTFLLARERLHRPDALAAEMAQLAGLDEDYATATREWIAAVHSLPGYRDAAVNTMSSMPQRSHGVVLQELQRQGSPEARQIGGTLTARWGDPLGGFRMLNAALPTASPQAIEILRQFLDALQSLSSPEAKRAQGMTFEAMAARTSGVQASRFHLEAARVYSEAGDSESARRTLGALATDPNSPRGIASDAGATLVTVLLDEGNPQAASRELSKQKTALSLDQYQTLSRRLARAFALAGDLDRADSAMIGDSTVEGFDLSGRLQLFRGNLAEASALLRSAGPYAGSRDEATSRTALLALLQPMQEDTLPELGVALLHLEQRDTVKAVAELQALAGKLPANAGGAELWLQVGRLQRARGKNAEAERAFRAASSGGTEATTPAASLELARLLVSVGRRAESQTILEQLILEHPQSAVVPQARRLLDELRGAVPQT